MTFSSPSRGVRLRETACAKGDVNAALRHRPVDARKSARLGNGGACWAQGPPCRSIISRISPPTGRPNMGRAVSRARRSSASRRNSIRSRCISTRRRRATPCWAGSAASGWHSCCIMMKMIADGLLLDTASMGAPGIEEVKWLKPMRPGRQPDGARQRALDARLAEQAGPRLRQFSLGGVQRSRRAGDDADLSADDRCGAIAERRHEIFRRHQCRRPHGARHAYVHGRGHQDVRGAIRPAGVSHGRGGGGEIAFRRAVRLGLAHDRGVDELARAVRPARGCRARARAAR